jgi:hypothetical protein
VYLSHYRTQQKSLERATAMRLMEVMLGPDRRFLDPCPEEVAALTLAPARRAVQAQLFTDNLEVTIVGDLAGVDMDAHLLQYLGTVQRLSPPQAEEQELVLNLTVRLSLCPPLCLPRCVLPHCVSPLDRCRRGTSGASSGCTCRTQTSARARTWRDPHPTAGPSYPPQPCR